MTPRSSLRYVLSANNTCMCVCVCEIHRASPQSLTHSICQRLSRPCSLLLTCNGTYCHFGKQKETQRETGNTSQSTGFSSFHHLCSFLKSCTVSPWGDCKENSLFVIHIIDFRSCPYLSNTVYLNICTPETVSQLLCFSRLSQVEHGSSEKCGLSTVSRDTKLHRFSFTSVIRRNLRGELVQILENQNYMILVLLLTLVKLALDIDLKFGIMAVAILVFGARSKGISMRQWSLEGLMVFDWKPEDSKLSITM